MPTDRPGRSTAASSAAIQINLTAAGWAVAALMVASIFISSSSRIAVGFLIPLAAALVIDIAVSWYIVGRQALSIVPSRTVAHLPDGIPVRLSVTGVDRPMRITATFRGGPEQAVGMGAGSTTIEIEADQSGVTNYLRTDLLCTVFGLGSAHRWQTHNLSMLHWAPAPDSERMPTPDAVDEVARLRAYVPGDRMSRVSWPVTARTGQMYVRAAGEGHEEFTIVLNLGEASIESTLVLASTLATQLLEDGHQVRLVTTELDQEAHRTLRQSAIDHPRLVPVLPEGTTYETAVIDRFVTDEDDLARRLALAEPGPTIVWPYGSWVDVSDAGITTLP